MTLIHLPSRTTISGKLKAVGRRVCPKSTKTICTCMQCDASMLGKITQVQESQNTIFDSWLNQIAKDIATGTNNGRPKIMAFSKSVVSPTPPPTELTDEFRAPTNVFNSAATIQILSTLGSTEFNSPSGTIKSIGFYFGADATTTVETGELGSLINDLDVSKDSSTEVTFQYDLTFASAT